MITKRRDIEDPRLIDRQNEQEKSVKKEKDSERTGAAGRTEGRRGAEDAELFNRFRSGDDGAFLELFDRHADRIGAYCYRMIGDHDRAQDVAQDVWEKFIKLRNNSDYDLRNPLGLLYTIARNLSLNHLRDRRDYVPLHALNDPDHPSEETRELSRLEEMAIMALQKLPLPQREILILHSYSDYTFEEIGEMIGETTGGVRTKAWRARRQLKRIIAALIEFEENAP